MRTNRRAAALIILVVAVGFTALSGRPQSFGLAKLSVGDCLYLETPSSKSMVPPAIPIGTLEEVQRTLANDGAQAARCNESHGHEVSAIVDLGDHAPNEPYPGLEVLQERVTPECVAAFEHFVGRALEGSAYDTVAVVPNKQSWAAGAARAACLVFGRDGRFLDHQAHNSGE
jgi:hypothetical protein